MIVAVVSYSTEKAALIDVEDLGHSRSIASWFLANEVNVGLVDVGPFVKISKLLLMLDRACAGILRVKFSFTGNGEIYGNPGEVSSQCRAPERKRYKCTLWGIRVASRPESLSVRQRHERACQLGGAP